jgi:DNA repair protein RadA/Sms
MVQAVLQRHCGLRLHNQDVFAATVGGAKLTEPASDLALAVALSSAVLSIPRRPGVVAVGEIGLAGELRRVRDLRQRVAEAARLGFAMVVVPGRPEQGRIRSVRQDGIDVVEAADIIGALTGAGTDSRGEWTREPLD